MSLAITVGMLSDLADLDPEGVESYREDFAAVNELLAENGLPPHAEPGRLPPLANRCAVNGFPYSFLHHLRRAYARRVVEPTRAATPVPDGESPTDDPDLDLVMSDLHSHLLCHSDTEGFYVPIDFRDVLYDETDRVRGCMVGSSHRLMDELLFVAPALGIGLRGRELPDEEAEAIAADAEAERGGLWIERSVWLSLFEAARLSIEHKAAICFS